MSPSLQKTRWQIFGKDPVKACPCPSQPQNTLLWLTIQNTTFAICSTCTSRASEKSPRGLVMSPFSCLSHCPMFGRLTADWLRLWLHFPTLPWSGLPRELPPQDSDSLLRLSETGPTTPCFRRLRWGKKNPSDGLFFASSSIALAGSQKINLSSAGVLPTARMPHYLRFGGPPLMIPLTATENDKDEFPLLYLCSLNKAASFGKCWVWSKDKDPLYIHPLLEFCLLDVVP